MNSNLLRQKITELTKKYSSKKVDEDLSFSDDYSAAESGAFKYQTKVKGAVNTINQSQSINQPTNLNELQQLESKSPQDATGKTGSWRYGKDEGHNEVKDTPKSRSISSGEKIEEHFESINSPKVVKQRFKSISNQSDLNDSFSDQISEELDDAREDSIVEDSDDSSDYHPLKNVHLVSDDFLEDINTASEASANSDNVEERLTNRSTPRSIRSIPLSPLISPPVINKKSEVKTWGFTSENVSVIEEQLQSVSERSGNYDSSFEEDKNSSDESKTAKKRESISTRSSFSSSNQTSRSNQHFESSTSASVIKTPSESSVQDSVTFSTKRKSGESTKSGSLNVILEPATSVSSEFDQQVDSSRSRKNKIEVRRKIEEGIQLGSNESKNSGERFVSELDDSVVSDHQKNVVPVLNDLEKMGKVDEDAEIGDVNKKKYIKFSYQSSHKDKLSKSRKGNISKYVQCNLISNRLQRNYRSRTPIYDLASSDREENISRLIQPRRKPLQIDTRVENLPRRPYIRTNIELYGVKDRLDSNLGFHVDSDIRNEDYNLNPTHIIAMDKILRNQINLTKYFMDSHHKMYMACCQIVKTMNEDYQNDGLIYDKR